MKTIFLLSTLALLSIFNSIIHAQLINYTLQEMKVINVSEVFDFTGREVIKSDWTDYYLPVHGEFYTYNINIISDNRKTGYDHQSSASPQQIWLDINNPTWLHTVFMYSSVADGFWADRTSLYFGSVDGGATWYELGPVPANIGGIGRSGFPAIYGTTSGKAVIINHNSTFSTPTRTKLYYDNSPFEYFFTEYDPGSPLGGETIWPRNVVLSNNKSVFAASVNGGAGFYTNTLLNGVFSGWIQHDGFEAETYSLAVSDGGKVGLAFRGRAFDDGDVFYSESADGGLGWTAPIKIWDATVDPGTGDFFGCLRGICLSFYAEQPCVVFELAWMNTAGLYYPERESEIRFWRPNLNSGFPVVLADTSNVPFFPSKGTNDVFVPICRPVIGRSQIFDNLFVAFNATSGEYWPGSSTLDSTSYFAGYFMLSGDGGESWTTPEKFTPESPLRDWRYISMAPVNPVQNEICTVHLVVQVDSVPGSNINASPPMPLSITAQYAHIATSLNVVPVELISFNSKLEGERVVLNWQTASELNNQGFEVQRKIIGESYDGEWIIRGFINGNGTTTENHAYTFFDDLNDLHFTSIVYRLRQVDFNGRYRYSYETTIDNSIEPYFFDLAQNYPNPFNPSTKIKFTIPQSDNPLPRGARGGFVILKVYDLLGNEVATLVKEEKTEGTYNVEFDGSGLTSGIYFYRLQAGSFVETKKMVLMK